MTYYTFALESYIVPENNSNIWILCHPIDFQITFI